MKPIAHQVEAHHRSGEPGRSAAADSGPLPCLEPPHDADLEAQITGLEALATNALRIEWRKLHRAEPPTRLSRDR
jgi:hypothetical protein